MGLFKTYEQAAKSTKGKKGSFAIEQDIFSGREGKTRFRVRKIL